MYDAVAAVAGTNVILVAALAVVANELEIDADAHDTLTGVVALLA
jgi:hypothetical protein